MDTTVVITLLVLAVVFVCIELGIAVTIALGLRRMGKTLDRMQAAVKQHEPAITEAREVLRELKGLVSSARTATDNLTGVTKTMRDQVAQVNTVIEETTDRARKQISKADEVVTRTIEKMETTSAIVQDNILEPVRELSALIRGLSGAMNFLFGRKRNPVNEVHQDEEMFI